MTTNITELVFILEKSGSMSGLESDTIGGYNAMLSKQQKEPGEANTVLGQLLPMNLWLQTRGHAKGICHHVRATSP